MLKKIIGNLLLISRIDNHQYQRDEAVDFGSMLRELAEDLEGRIEDKGLTLSIEVNQVFDFRGNRNLAAHLVLQLAGKRH
jgi:signal transduction histidine kinase